TAVLRVATATACAGEREDEKQGQTPAHPRRVSTGSVRGVHDRVDGMLGVDAGELRRAALAQGGERLEARRLAEQPSERFVLAPARGGNCVARAGHDRALRLDERAQ